MPFPEIQRASNYLDQDQPDRALRILQRLNDQFPSYVVVHLLLARAHRLKGDKKAALQAWRNAYFWVPHSSYIREELACILRRNREGVDDAEPEEESAQPDEELPSVRGSGGTRRPLSPQELAADLEARKGQPEDIDDDIEDLDSLIQQLKEARIIPEPDVGSMSGEDLDMDDESDEMDEEVVSETLARIYAAQKEYEAAADTYRELAETYPEREEEFLDKAAEMDKKAQP